MTSDRNACRPSSGKVIMTRIMFIPDIKIATCHENEEK